MRKLRSVFPITPFSSPDRSRSDSGLTLVEMVVALMVFAIISLGVAYSMLATLQSTRDSRGRQVAANLAAQEIDLVRSVDDIFSVNSVPPRVVRVGGTDYTITRTTGWANSGITSDDCGSGDGVLQHKRVNVVVTWGTGGATRTVRSDTIVAPTSKINDPTLGTIVVHVTLADGTGAAGVSVSVKPSVNPEGAAALTEAVPATDSSGCAFALKLKPGNYDVTIQKTGYVTDAHAAVETQTNRRVTQGSATTVSFAYDMPVSFTPTYAHSALGTVTIPSALDVSYTSTAGTYLSRADQPTPKLFPVMSGYTVLAGKIAAISGGAMACDAIDPSRWPEVTRPDGSIAAGYVVLPSSAVPGTTGTASIPVAVVKVTMPAGSSAVVTATSVAPTSAPPKDAPVSDTPTCDIAMSYSLGAFSGERQFVLPFGAWTLTTPSGTVGVMVGTSVRPVTGGSVVDGTVTLDPRVTVTP